MGRFIWENLAILQAMDFNGSPKFFEGVLMETNRLKPIICRSDCTWGLLDSLNSNGLCTSLTFGGRLITHDGFGIPLLLRYALETFSNTVEAIEKLKDISTHMSYNITFMNTSMNWYS